MLARSAIFSCSKAKQTKLKEALVAVSYFYYLFFTCRHPDIFCPVISIYGLNIIFFIIVYVSINLFISSFICCTPLPFLSQLLLSFHYTVVPQYTKGLCTFKLSYYKFSHIEAFSFCHGKLKNMRCISGPPNVQKFFNWWFGLREVILHFLLTLLVMLSVMLNFPESYHGNSQNSSWLERYRDFPSRGPSQPPQDFSTL